MDEKVRTPYEQLNADLKHLENFARETASYQDDIVDQEEALEAAHIAQRCRRILDRILGDAPDTIDRILEDWPDPTEE